MNSKQLSTLIIDALDDIKAQDIVKLDVRDMTTVTDYMIVASGTSNRHVQALVDNVAEKAKKAGFRPIGVEGEEAGEWVLLDLQDRTAPAHNQSRADRRALVLRRGLDEAHRVLRGEPLRSAATL